MKALICGISGQDGAYLSKLLLQKGYDVYGTSRDAESSKFENLQALGIKEKVTTLSMAVSDFRSVLQVLQKVKPDEIYYLAGQSSVGLSFEQPIETLDSIAGGILNMLEALRFTGWKLRLYNAGSSECYGDTKGQAADESSPFQPKSPYAVGKASAYWIVSNYREAYDIHACSGILFNHESPLRPTKFVTKKVISAVCRIANGSDEKLHLGNISIERDWGWAPEYVEAMWLMLQQDKPEDFVIATGSHYSLEEFVARAFAEVNLDWNKYVVIDSNLFRPADIKIGYGNAHKAKNKLGWQATYKMPDVVKMMIEAERKELNK